MKKILTSIFGIAAALLVFVGCPTSPESTASLTLDKNALVITSALGGYTNQTLTATLENSSASLEWYSTNSKIVSVSASGKTATLVCEGTAGTARVGVMTSDGKLEASCSVRVVLSETPAQSVSDVVVLEGSQTVSGFTLTWQYPNLSAAAVIDVFETSEAQENANKLAASSSSEEPTVYKTYLVKRDISSSSAQGTYTISDLLSNASGKIYYFSVYGYLNGKRSTSYVNSQATLLADSVAPGNVSNVEATLTDHSIVLSWTEPEDQDYASVIVSISPLTDFAGNELAPEVKTQTLKKGVTTATFANLAAQTEHTFTFETADTNGNVQGDSHNAENAGTSVAFTTDADTTPPASVSDLTASGGRTSVTLTWKDPADFDLKEIHVYRDDSSTYTVAKGTQTLQISSLNELTQYTFNVKAADYNGNESTLQSATVSTQNPVATNVSATFGDIDFDTVKAKGVVVSWNAPTAVEYDSSNVQVTYKYKVVVQKGETEVESKETETGKTSYTLTNTLDFDTEYTFTVKTIPSDELSKEFTSDDSSLAKSFVALVSIKNGWGGRVLVPFITSNNENHVNCVIAQETGSQSNTNLNVFTYPYWIVRKALDSTQGKFSLEAAKSDGTASGLYLYFSNTQPSGTVDYDVDNRGWGSGSNPHSFIGTTDTINADSTAYKSFSFGSYSSATPTAISSYSEWKTIECTTDSATRYCDSDNSNPRLVTSSSFDDDYAWCYKTVN